MLLYGPVIYRWCRRSNLAAEDAADVVQEVLAAALVHLPDFRREKPEDSFSGWLAAITRNKVRELFAAGKAGPRPAAAAPPCGRWPKSPSLNRPARSIQPDAQAAACLSRRVLEVIRSEFEDRTWRAFWRVSVGGESASHVAADLGMSVAAVYKAKSRVLGRLRQVLAELPE